MHINLYNNNTHHYINENTNILQTIEELCLRNVI